ncbi:MAG: serine hydroxymethyltransferase [Coriobacteriales bacterium]|nr:serine hydroxymethyltransferase [Coriobacteriales bacterium]
MNYDFIKQSDPDVFYVMEQELNRQRDHIELIASENFTSEAVMEAMGSHLTNKYAEGYPGARFYGGCENVDVIEDIARRRAKSLYGAEYANVQPHAGSQANVAVYTALLDPGDTILGMSLDAGGHLTHGSRASMTGRYWKSVSYGVDKETELINYDEVLEIAKREQPKIIVCGASAYPRFIDFAKFREIADEVNAYLMVDIAHIGGLVAAGVHPSPVPYADVVTSTTHKTLRGPRGAIILCKEELGKRIDHAVFPGTQGGPLMHVIAAKAICLKEAMLPDFKDYQAQIVKNAAVLAKTLQDGGIRLTTGGTDNHLMMADVSSKQRTGLEVQLLLDKANITANKNAIPFDPLPKAETSGVRFGTPAITTRKFSEKEIKQIGNWIIEIIEKGEGACADIKTQVIELCAKHPLYPHL